MKNDQQEVLDKIVRERFKNFEGDLNRESFTDIINKTAFHPSSKPPQTEATSIYKWLVAACLAGFIVVAYLFLQHGGNETLPAKQLALSPSDKPIPAKSSAPRTTTQDAENQIPLDVKEKVQVSENVHHKAPITAAPVSPLTSIESEGAKKELILPDGSKINLNSHSRVVYDKEAYASAREVELDGEAFFEINKVPGKNFKVKCRRSVVVVLGTSFNLNSRKELESDEVNVVSGLVSFSRSGSDEQRILLGPGERGYVNTENLSKDSSGNGNFMSWKSGQFTFKKTPLSEVFRLMESYFSIHFTISNPELLKCTYTGSFNKPELEEMMKVVGSALDITYTAKDNVWMLEGKGCN